MKRNILVLAICAACSISTAQAQNQPSEKLQEFVDKKMEKNGIQATKTHQLKAKDYEAPKKIGILVFAIQGSDEYTGSYSGFMNRYNVYEKISEDAASIVAQTLHDDVIVKIKENYLAQGVEVFTPNEYLDTDTKREAFQAMDMQVLGLAKVAYTIPDQIGLPDGYRYFTNSTHTDIGGRADIAEELKMFGMDGYLSIFVDLYGPTTIIQIKSNLILLKDRDYVSKIKKETFRRSDVSQKMLPMSYTQILASERDKLRAGHGKNDNRDKMIDFTDGEVWIDPNVAKVIEYSVNLYFPMVK